MIKLNYLFLFLCFCGNCLLQAQEVNFDENTYYQLNNAWMGEGRSLDVNPENGAIVMAPTSGDASQSWKISALGDGWYKLSTKAYGEGKVIDVINDGNNNLMALADNAEYGGQFWYIVPSLQGGYFTIINGWQNEKAMDCDSDQTGSGAYLNPIGEYSGQFWQITAVANTSAEMPDSTMMETQSVQIGDKAHGGIVFFVDADGQHGLVCQESQFERKMSFQIAKEACENSDAAGFDDWRLPHPEELFLLYHNLHMTDIYRVQDGLYWTDHVSDEHHMWGLDLHNAEMVDHLDTDRSPVWAVRKF